jgi:hypothetical protein
VGAVPLESARVIKMEMRAKHMQGATVSMPMANAAIFPMGFANVPAHWFLTEYWGVIFNAHSASVDGCLR